MVCSRRNQETVKDSLLNTTCTHEKNYHEFVSEIRIYNFL
ncbi:hypothetical protein LEP1GSC081_0021 [Leptospira kirschneri str. H1]|uniref:Uncharacterized protein n=1 Tax=Leptospira kirschneri str. H1 TaxID=1049966 RepID=A0A0E2B8K0_9LEPT|nr:hypothetical protein LEP1GSC081_0021 [Leptospira kirschneri str. H1]